MTQAFSPKVLASNRYLEPSRAVTARQLESLMKTLYNRYGFDDDMIVSYIQETIQSDSCVRRDELADVLLTMIGHHPSVLIGDNDSFLRLVQERIVTQPIITRRESITNIIAKIQQTDNDTLQSQ